jgi:hypothetical protein
VILCTSYSPSVADELKDNFFLSNSHVIDAKTVFLRSSDTETT